MSRQLKNHIQRDLKRRFGSVDGYILVDYRGLNSTQSYDLRKTLLGVGIRMNVVPNRLALRILDRWEGKRPEFRQFFRGPTAVLYGTDGPLAASRAVVQWKRKNKDLLGIKGGVLGGEIMPPSAVERLSRIPDRPQLLAQVVGTFQAPVARLLGATQGPLRKLVGVLEAYRKKVEESAPPGASSPEAREDSSVVSGTVISGKGISGMGDSGMGDSGPDAATAPAPEEPG